jgi:hypothetical protein
VAPLALPISGTPAVAEGEYYLVTWEDAINAEDATGSVIMSVQDVNSGEYLRPDGVIEEGHVVRFSAATDGIGGVHAPGAYAFYTFTWDTGDGNPTVNRKQEPTDALTDSFEVTVEKDIDVTLTVAAYRHRKLEFDGNGGTGGGAVASGINNTVDYPEYLIDSLPAGNEFRMSGKLWAGWNTQPDGNGTTFMDGDEFDMAEENGYSVSVAVNTLYAMWADDTLALREIADEPVGPVEEGSGTLEDPYVVSAVVPTEVASVGRGDVGTYNDVGVLGVSEDDTFGDPDGSVALTAGQEKDVWVKLAPSAWQGTLPDAVYFRVKLTRDGELHVVSWEDPVEVADATGSSIVSVEDITISEQLRDDATVPEGHVLRFTATTTDIGPSEVAGSDSFYVFTWDTGGETTTIHRDAMPGGSLTDTFEVTVTGDLDVRLTVEAYYHRALKFDGNGGTGGGYTANGQANTVDDPGYQLVQLPDGNEYRLTGKIWDYWNTKPDGSGTTYHDFDDFDMTEVNGYSKDVSSVTLYAMWTDDTNALKSVADEAVGPVEQGDGSLADPYVVSVTLPNSVGSLQWFDAKVYNAVSVYGISTDDAFAKPFDEVPLVAGQVTEVWFKLGPGSWYGTDPDALYFKVKVTREAPAAPSTTEPPTTTSTTSPSSSTSSSTATSTGTSSSSTAKPTSTSSAKPTTTSTAKPTTTSTATPTTTSSSQPATTATSKPSSSSAKPSSSSAKPSGSTAEPSGSTATRSPGGTTTAKPTTTAAKPSSTATATPHVANAAIASVGYTGTTKVAAKTTAKTGAVLTAKVGAVTPSDAELAYQWLRDGKAIIGATKAKYTVTAADAGHALTLKVTASKTGYQTVSKTSSAVTAGLAALYRFYSSKRTGHFFTASEQEKADVLRLYKDYAYEGVEGYVVEKTSSPDAGELVVYRFYNGTTRAHFYTTDAQEAKELPGKYNHVWSAEGIAYYIVK